MDKSIPESSINPFLQAGHDGLHSIWRYLASIFIIILAVLPVNLFASIVVVAVTGTVDINAMPPAWVFILAMSTFPPAMIGLLFCVRTIHARDIKSLVTVHPKPKWKIFWFSGMLWLLISIMADIFLAIAATPGNYQYSFNPENFFGFALLVLCLLPIQTSTEELFFRGYLMQGFSRINRSTWVPVLCTSLAFAGLHIANPEVSRYGFWTMMAFYFGIGMLLAWVTLYTKGLEAALGLHLANNIYAALFVTFPGSALNTPALFSLKEYHPLLSLAVFLGMALLYILAIKVGMRNRNEQAENPVH